MPFVNLLHVYMGVSKNRGTPKSSILIGFSIINHPFWGTPIFGNTHIKLPQAFWILFMLINLPKLPQSLETVRRFPFGLCEGMFSFLVEESGFKRFHQQEFQVPKMEVLNLIAGDLGVDFPLHRPYPYSLHHGEDSSILGTFPKCLVSSGCDTKPKPMEPRDVHFSALSQQIWPC